MATAFNEPKYQIEVSDFQCHACHEEIPCEKPYFSAVFFVQEAFRRKNYCVPCWMRAVSPGSSDAHPQVREPSGELSDVFAFWRTKRPPKPSDKPNQLRFDPEVVLQFFRSLGEDDLSQGAGERDGAVESDAVQLEAPAEAASDATTLSPPPSAPSREERDELRFVLALLLIRRKTLNFLSSRFSEGEEWLKLSEKADPRSFHWVRNPNMADSRLEAIKDRIGELLNMRV